MRKWTWIGGGGLLVVIIAVLVWKLRPDTTVAATAQPEPVAVVKGNIFQAVASTGRIVSNRDSDIKCKASGEVLKLPFDVSDSVKKGDLLVEIDPIDEERAVQQAKATLAASTAKLAQAKQNVLVADQNLIVSKAQAAAGLLSAKAKMDDARARYQSRKELSEQKLLAAEDVLTFATAASQAEADLATANAAVEAVKSQELGLEVKREDVKLAQADVDSDAVSLANAEQRLKDTRVEAPFDGVVAARTIQVGTIIASGVTNVAGGTTVLTLSDLSHVFVYATVDESDIGRVAIDQPVTITADAFPGTRFRGKVVRIATKGVNLNNVVTFEVRIEVISENKGKLKPEMTANVQIVAGERNNVLVVPSAAVTRKQNTYTVTAKKPDGGTEEAHRSGWPQ